MKQSYDCSMEYIEHKGGRYGFPPWYLLSINGAIIHVTIENTSYETADLKYQKKIVEPFYCSALVDTGAAFCIIRPKIVEALRLKKMVHRKNAYF